MYSGTSFYNQKIQGVNAGIETVFPWLDVLRFFLATCVVLYHFPETAKNLGLDFSPSWTLFQRGPHAVFYFFTLSGFLIGRNLLLEMERKGSIHLKAFFLKRALRIAPLYGVIIVLGLVLYKVIVPLVYGHERFNFNSFELVCWYIGMLPNVYNKLHHVGGILNITWSIGIEEQVYMVFPFLVLGFKRYLPQALLGLGLSFMVLLTTYPFFFNYSGYYHFFVGGAGMAYFSIRFKPNRKAAMSLFIMAWVIVAIGFLTPMVSGLGFTQHQWLQTLLSAVVVYGLSLDIHFPEQLIFPQYLGKLSYGIYMYHMVVFTLLLSAVKLGLGHSEGGVVFLTFCLLCCYLLTLVLAHYSFSLLELPIRQWVLKKTDRIYV